MKSLAMLVILGACAGSSTAGRDSLPAGTSATIGSDSVRVLAQLQSSGWADREIVIIDDSTALAASWARLHANRSDIPPAPVVRFGAERVVVAAAGTRSSGGFVMTAGAFTQSGDTVIVDVTLLTPGPECGVTAALTEPVIMFAIPRTAAPPRISTTERAGPAC